MKMRRPVTALCLTAGGRTRRRLGDASSPERRSRASAPPKPQTAASLVSRPSLEPVRPEPPPRRPASLPPAATRHPSYRATAQGLNLHTRWPPLHDLALRARTHHLLPLIGAAPTPTRLVWWGAGPSGPPPVFMMHSQVHLRTRALTPSPRVRRVVVLPHAHLDPRGRDLRPLFPRRVAAV